MDIGVHSLLDLPQRFGGLGLRQCYSTGGGRLS